MADTFVCLNRARFRKSHLFQRGHFMPAQSSVSSARRNPSAIIERLEARQLLASPGQLVGGDIAAQTVIDEIARSAPPRGDWLQEAAQRANSILWNRSRAAGPKPRSRLLSG